MPFRYCSSCDLWSKVRDCEGVVAEWRDMVDTICVLSKRGRKQRRNVNMKW